MLSRYVFVCLDGLDGVDDGVVGGGGSTAASIQRQMGRAEKRSNIYNRNLTT